MIPCIWTLYGPNGSIKSSQAILFPGKIGYYNMEHGAHRAWGWKDGVKDGSILPREVNVPEKSMTRQYAKLTGWKESWQRLSEDVDRDFNNQEIKSIVFDTGTVAWALDRDAYLEEIQETHAARKQLIRIEYGEPNRRMEMFYTRPHVTDTHLIVIHHETDHYVPLIDSSGRPIMDEDNRPASAADGTKVPDGFKSAMEKSDWVLYFEHKVPGKPTVTIKKSAYGFDLIEMVITMKQMEDAGGIYNVLDKRLEVLGRL
jgi:hypothetical protein